eukprot:TRINITY_DN16344_c0_g1_i1.p1 TRINITY_DN16344_c0_g1~~TRINITY_DN16344_c0_g1_i1.p1  ORF type:complete len:239 (+),score=34.70 TRINITY_DN16344_c0_g1_i1:70-786(+)
MANSKCASTAGRDIVCQGGLLSNILQAAAEIADDFLELGRHGAEQMDTLSVCATVDVLLAPAYGVAIQGAPTHALVSQAATEIIGPETTGLLSAALISVSVGRFLCSDWMQRPRSYVSKASESFCHGLHGYWTASIHTWATPFRLGDCVGRSSDVLASSQDVALKEAAQTETGDGTGAPEQRLDPLDRGIYTYQEVAIFYKAFYSPGQIKSYWDNTCRRVRRRRTGMPQHQSEHEGSN